MTTLTDFLLARIAEDEAVARGAIDPERPGTHWRWIDAGEQGGPAEPDPETGGEYLDMQASIWLCTVEEFPTSSVGPLPAVAIASAQEVKSGAAAHIACFDPARVLAECEAKRRIVHEFTGESPHANYDDCGDECVGNALHWVLRVLAQPYADHPDYREEWRA